jgi:hypothetical protein
MGWHGVTEVVCAQECICTDPHCCLGYGWGCVVAHVFRAQSAAQVSVLSLEKICKNVEIHTHCKTMFQKQDPADLQPFRHDEEYTRCHIRYRIRYHTGILYIVYDIACIHYVVYYVQYIISYMILYTISCDILYYHP